jgi:hypothetical protein
VALSTASGEASLLNLFPKVIGLLADNWSILGSTTDILEGYLLLDASVVLQVRLSSRDFQQPMFTPPL